MTALFLKLVNMSVAAGWTVVAVLLLRLLFKKAPKWLTVLLWGMVAVRLLCPVSLESVWSLIPSAETVSPQLLTREPVLNTGIAPLDETLNPLLQHAEIPVAPEKSVPLLQLLALVFSKVWLAGVAGMLVYTAVSWFRVKRSVGTAVLLRENIYQSEQVPSPFVLGLVRPKIYLPFAVSEQNAELVIAHEQAHLRRKDHWWKPLGFLLLTLHWFNPLMWVGYLLLCRDIELACDEKVIKDFNAAQKADYSEALLTCSVHRRRVAACPLAFGEGGVKKRIQSVLCYKKPAFWLVVAAVVVSLAAAVCLLTNPQTTLNDELSVFLDMQIAEHHYAEGHTDQNFITIHHKLLGKKVTPKATTVYLWVLYHEYSLEEGEIKEQAGAHIPTVITVKRTGKHRHYELVEYWEPRDGSYYAKDIRQKFPWYLRGKALDSQRYIKEQEAFCRNAAEEYFAEQMGVLFKEYDGKTPIKTPPSLIVVSNEQSLEAAKGTYSWDYSAGEHRASVEADAMHPMDSLEEIPVVELMPSYLAHVNPLEAILQWNAAESENAVFILKPDTVTVVCMEEGGGGTPLPVETVLNNGNLFIKLKEGNFVYEVTAGWSRYAAFEGTARYRFRTSKPNLDWKSYPMVGVERTVKETYPQTPADQTEEGRFVYTKTHVQTDDGMWMADGYGYLYRLELTGRLHGAEKDTTYLVLSNRKGVTFEEAWKASGLSSSTADRFHPAEAVVVGYK